jgi:YbbR domain-containing protein
VPFRRAITNNMHIKISALVVGIVLWMFAKGEQEATRLFSIPLILRNVPEGLTTVEKVPEKVDVVLQGDNKELTRLSLWGDPRAVVDMSGAQAGRTFRVGLSAANIILPGDAQVQVVEVRDPRNLDMEIDELVDHRIAVEPQVSGSPAEGFFKSVSTAPLDIEGRRSPVDVTRRVEVEGKWNLHAVPKEVRVLVDIEGTRVTTLPKVPLMFEHEPGFARATIEPESVEVTLSGPEHVTLFLDAEDITAFVDAMGLPRGTHQLVPEVTVPEGVEVQGVTPERVTVTLQ